MLRITLATACAALLAAGGLAQDAVTIQWPVKAKLGDRVRVTESEKSKTSSEVVVAGEKMSMSSEDRRDAVYVQELLAGTSGEKGHKFTRTYEKYEGVSDGKPEAGPPLDTVITIEKKGDKYTFDAGAKKLDAEFVKLLDKEFNKPADEKEKGVEGPDFLPTKPVKPGDTWKVPFKKFLGKLSDDDAMVFDKDKATGTGKLVRVYTKGGHKFGVVELTMAAPITSLGKDQPFKVSGGRMECKLTLDVCLDRKVPNCTATTLNKVSVQFADAMVKGGFSFEASSTTTEELLNKK